MRINRMALKRFVEKIESVPEELRALYVEQDNGGFRLDAEADDGGELKGALEKARNERDKVKRERDALAAKVDGLASKLDGVDLDELLKRPKQGAKQKKEEADDIELQLEAAREEGRAQITEKLGREVSTLTQDRDGLRAAIQTTIVREAAISAIARKGANATLLTDPVLKHLRPVADGNGGFVVRVFNENGGERISQIAGNDGPMTVDELLNEFETIKDYAPAFPGTGATGSGAPANSNGGAGAATTKAELGSSANKSAYINKYGREAYQELPDTA